MPCLIRGLKTRQRAHICIVICASRKPWAVLFTVSSLPLHGGVPNLQLLVQQGNSDDKTQESCPSTSSCRRPQGCGDRQFHNVFGTFVQNEEPAAGWNVQALLPHPNIILQELHCLQNP